MKIRDTSLGITPVVVFHLLMLVWSAPVSGQTQQPGSDLPAPTPALNAGPASSSASISPEAASSSAVVSRPPTRTRAVRSLVRRSVKPAAKEASGDPAALAQNPAVNAASQAVLQPAAESSVNPAPAETAGVSAPVENYPPDPTPALPPPATKPDSSPSKTATQPQIEHAEPVAAISDYSMVKAAGGFGLVLCLIALAYVGGRKLFPKYFARGAAERSLKLVETLAIGEKRSIAIIEFDDQRLIIGNTPTQITLLATLPLKLSLVEDSSQAPAPSFEFSKSKTASDSFRGLYEIEKTNGRGNRKAIPPDIQAKMRQLRESLEP